jgi:hypothetical protein
MAAMRIVLIVAAALASAAPEQAPPADPPAPAAPAPAAPAPAPSRAPGASPSPAPLPAEPAATEPAESAAPAAPARRRVWIFIDRWKEFGGDVVREDEHEIAVSDGVETRKFQKATVMEVVDLVDPAPGQSGVIQFRDGSALRAEIVSDTPAGVEFRRDGLVGNLPRTRVYRVVLVEDFEVRLARAKEGIGQREYGRRLGLARWLASEERFDLAIAELEALLRDADIEEARDLLRYVRARVALAAAARKPGTDAGGEGSAAPRADRPPDPEESLLTDEEVNLVRVYEIDFRDPPRLSVPEAAVRELVRKHSPNPLLPSTEEGMKALLARPQSEIAALFFAVKARDLYRLIEVKEDPASLAKFRTRVHNAWLVPNCATSRCHGGSEAGAFRLRSEDSRDDRVRYSNLMTVLTAKVDGRPIVDFERPERSILIQYAMPRDRASTPHPDVKGWKPALGEGNQLRLTDSLDWIRSMYRPRPDYPITFEPLAPPAAAGPDR